MISGNMATGHLYGRLIPLVLLLVDGIDLLFRCSKLCLLLIYATLNCYCSTESFLIFLSQVVVPLTSRIQGGNCIS